MTLENKIKACVENAQHPNRDSKGRFIKGYQMDDKIKKKISKFMKGKVYNKGKKHSEETKKKISESTKGEKHYNYGKKTSLEIKQKISKNNARYWLGKKRPEISEKISKALKGRKKSENSIKKFILKRTGIKSKIKGMNFEQIYGKERAEIIKNKIKKARKKQVLTEERNKKISSTMKCLYKNNLKYKELAKERRAKRILPIKDTSIEVKIQNFLKTLRIEFFTHQYIKDIEHSYQCDILIPSMNMVIECDGNYWHKYPIGREIDHIRTKELLEKGFKVLRLWEIDIRNLQLNQFKRILKSIRGWYI